MKLYSLVKTILMIWLLLLSSAVLSKQNLTFSSAGPLHPKKVIVLRVLEEAYQRLGIDIEIRHYPAERSLRTANAGEEVDGELFRGVNAKIEENYLNLLKIPVALTYGEFVVFTRDTSFDVDGWDSLRPYHIGIEIGVKGIELGTEGMNVEKVPETDKLFLMLAEGRFDIAVAPRTVGLMHLTRLRNLYGEYENFRYISVLEPPLKKDPLFHYLHAKHADIATRLTKVLEEMRDNGEIQKVIDRTMIEIMEKF